MAEKEAEELQAERRRIVRQYGLVPPVPGTVLETTCCERCPLTMVASYGRLCRITSDHVGGGNHVPDWCPLLTGPVLVRLAEKGETDG
jgi:hypothetical protein